MTITSAAPADATAIARAAAIAQAAPADAGAWLALIALLQQAQRTDEENEALAQARRHLPAHPQILLAAGTSALRQGRLDEAERALAQVATLEPSSATPLVVLAQVAERKGDLAATLRHVLRAVDLDPRQAPVLLAVGRGLHSVGRLDEAEEAYRRAAAAQPDTVEAWRTLATLLLERHRPAQAMRALDHALKLAPTYSDLHALAGEILEAGKHFDGAASAYENALRLYPKSADWMNRLGCLQKALGQPERSEATLRGAVALEPKSRVARENLVTMLVEQQRVPEARALLREAVALPGLVEDARRNAAAVLAIFHEHDRLQPLIVQAVAQGNDAMLARAVSMTPDVALTLDAPRVEMLRSLSLKTGGPVRDRENERFARGLPAWSGWPVFEAHFALHGGDDVAAIAGTAEVLRAAAAIPDAEQVLSTRKLRSFVRAIALRRTLPPAAATPAAGEARLRFWHATIGLDDADYFAGQVKPIPNLVSTNPSVIRTPLDAVPGTWRKLMGEYRSRAQPGPWRAALLYFAIVDIHGFRNGNGRLARFMMNVELEAAGYHPIVHSDRLVKSMAAALSAVRHLDDLEPLVDLFARAGTETAALVAAAQAQVAVAH